MALLAVLDGCDLHDVIRNRGQPLNALLTPPAPSGRDEGRAYETCHRA